MTAGRICVRSVQTAAPDETVRQAARRMAQARVGSLVVVGPDQRPLGILTDRDLVLRCVADERNPDETQVGEVMTAPVDRVHESTPIETALSRMEGVDSRRLVVVDDEDRLAGLLALDDVLELLAEEAATIGRLVGEHLPHR